MYRQRRRLVFSFLVAVPVIFATGIVGYRALDTLVRDQQDRIDARLVAIQVETLLSLTTQAETGQRGYVITGRESYLQPYEDAKQKIGQTVNSLRKAFAASPGELRRLDEIESLQRQKFAELQESIDTRRERGFEAAQAIVLSDRGKLLMDAIRADVHGLEQAQAAQLDQHIARSEKSVRQAYLILTMSGLLNAGLMVFLTIVVRADLLARQKAVQQMADARTLLENIVDSSSAAIYLLDPEGRLTLANKALQSFMKTSREALLGKTAFDLFPPEYAKRQAEKTRLVIERNDAIVFEEKAPLPEGVRYFLTSKVPIHDHEGHLLGICGVSSDITTLKLAEEEVRTLNQSLEQRVEERTQELARVNAELQQANSYLESFSYTVAHDLRAPLRGMQGFAEAIAEDYGDRLDVTAHDYLRRITRAAQRMEQLIEDLLAFSRLARADMPLEKVRFSEVIREVLTNLNRQIVESHASVTVEDRIPVVIGNWTACVQALQNLVANALKFSRAGVPPEVRIYGGAVDETEACGRKRVRISVEDHGIGIASHQQEQIFRPFERLHGIEEYAGTGIGLAVVAKAVERMHGRYGVQSEPGKGAHFWIELPEGDEP
jgi:PAS domain S-box-containing protein